MRPTRAPVADLPAALGGRAERWYPVWRRAEKRRRHPRHIVPRRATSGVSTQVIDGEIAQNLTIFLQPSTNYAVICFIEDREGGKPHVAKGMIEELKVGELKYE